MDVEKRKGAGINSALAVIDEDYETSFRRLTIHNAVLVQMLS